MEKSSREPFNITSFSCLVAYAYDTFIWLNKLNKNPKLNFNLSVSDLMSVFNRFSDLFWTIQIQMMEHSLPL